MAFCSHPAHPGTSVGGGPWRKEADPASSAPQAHPSDTIVSDLKKKPFWTGKNSEEGAVISKI